ncbi:MAG TPA: hypothetical protein VGJ93_14715 [Desulfuromonadaceae bacterium]
MEKKDAFSQKLENQVKEWKKAIDDLQERAQKSTTHAKLELLEMVERLQLKMDAVQIRLDELRRSSSEAWSGIEKKIEVAVAEMKTALEQARNKFKH